MRVSNKGYNLKINVIGWWLAKGMAPCILKVWKIVIIWERYVEHNNHCSY